MVMMGVRGEEGQGLVEYALIIILVSVALVGALTLFGGDLSGVYSKIADKVANPLGSSG